MIDPSSTKPGDLYIDPAGQVWRVVGVCMEPTVTMDRLSSVRDMERGSPYEPRISGGVRGFMWNGFKLLKEAD